MFHIIIHEYRAVSLQWRHNEPDYVPNHQPHDCLHNRLFRRTSKKTSKLHVTGLCVGNSPGTGEFPAQRASNAENVSIWWRHHVSGVLAYLRDKKRAQNPNSTKTIIFSNRYLSTSNFFYLTVWAFMTLSIGFQQAASLSPDDITLFNHS